MKALLNSERMSFEEFMQRMISQNMFTTLFEIDLHRPEIYANSDLFIGDLLDIIRLAFCGDGLSKVLTPIELSALRFIRTLFACVHKDDKVYLKLDKSLSAIFKLSCPETGSFIGYKKCVYYDPYTDFPTDVIVTLEIPEDAKRSSAFGKKCRCDKAKVADIRSIDGKDRFECAVSKMCPEFEYNLGQIVSVNDFDECRWNECSTGIHFFMDKQDAISYNL